MFRIRLNLIRIYVGVFFLLLVLLSLSSTPISDEYCMAFGVRTFGLNASLKYLLENWSPSIYYFWILLPWKFDLPTTLITSLFGVTSFLLASLIFYRAISSIVAYEVKSKPNEVRSYLIIGLVTSLTFVQSSVYFVSESARNFEVKSIFFDWIIANFIQIRDGQILRWSFATPLTSLKLVMSALIIYFLASTVKYFERNQVNQLFFRFFMATLVALSFGINHEVVTFLVFTMYISITQIFSGQKRFQFSFLLILVLLSVAALYKSPGSSLRLEAMATGPKYNLFALFIGNVWQLTWVTLVVLIASYITHLGYSHSKNYFKFSFSEVTRNLLRALAVVSLVSQILLETLSYPAAYHWISYICIIFLYSFVEINTSKRIELVPKLGRNSSRIVFNFMIIFTIMSILITLGVSSKRYSDWNLRSNLSKASNSQIKINIPHLDNLGNIYAEDMNVDYGSIIPFQGYKKSFTSFCYKNLNVGF